MDLDLSALPAPVQIPVLILTGAATGILSAFFGVGGGWVVTPVLNFLGMPMANAVGTGLLFIFGTSLYSSWRHRRQGHVAGRAGVVIALSMALGIWGGKQLVLYLEQLGRADSMIRGVYLLFLGVVGVYMTRRGLAQPLPTPVTTPGPSLFHRLRGGPMLNVRGMEQPVPLWPMCVTGIFAGLLSGLLGVGGGIVIFPVLVYLAGMPTVMAVGTSLLAICLAAPMGVAGYALAQKVEFDVAAFLVTGAVFGAAFGVYATTRVKSRILELLYGLSMLAGAGSVLLMQWHCRLAAVITILSATGGLALTIVGLTLRRTAQSNRSVNRETLNP